MRPSPASPDALEAHVASVQEFRQAVLARLERIEEAKAEILAGLDECLTGIEARLTPPRHETFRH